MIIVGPESVEISEGYKVSLFIDDDGNECVCLEKQPREIGGYVFYKLSNHGKPGLLNEDGSLRKPTCPAQS